MLNRPHDNANAAPISGFVLSRHVRDVQTRHGRRAQIELWVKTDQAPLQVLIQDQELVFFIPTQMQSSARTLAQNLHPHIRIKALDLKNFSHQDISAVYCPSLQSQQALCQALDTANIIYFEHDIRHCDRYLMERFIQGGIEVYPQTLQQHMAQTNSSPYMKVYNPKCKSTSYLPKFTSVSLDIECSEKGVLYSIGLDSAMDSRVIMVGSPNPRFPYLTEKPSDLHIQWVDDEKQLLDALCDWFERFDPDLILGWNVIDFDCRLLAKRAQVHQHPLKLGRDGQSLYFRQSNQNNQGFVTISGRVVLDGILLLKSATFNFPSWSLESVAQHLFNEGKAIDHSQDKMAEINRLFREDKHALAIYNLQDCRLVNRIFEHTHLLDYSIERSRLTGLDLDRMGGSVAAFTNLYLPRLHRAGYVAPNLESDNWIASPGGYVMDSKPGLYDSVLVLDFKSLYPSIIRTFCIDPLGLIEGLTLEVGQGDDQAIAGFRGGQFHRSRHFLPEMISQLWQARDRAKAQNETAFSTAIKIIMNSFYGVLGSSGCRFFDTRLASSITMRGHEIMKKTCIFIEDKGYNVIYGDTDSLFVALNTRHDSIDADRVGKQLAEQINAYWQTTIHDEFNLTSALELEYETHYLRFLMPTIRGAQTGSKKRYCGLIEKDDKQRLIFKGLESARSDWTPLAQKFQLHLYQMIFNHQDPQAYIRQFTQDTLAGKYDDDLVYQKRLRQKLALYTKNVPPQVRAARLADIHNQRLGRPLQYQNKGTIRYLITQNGPEPEDYLESPIDYQHYLDKQLKPVADAILPFIDLEFDRVIAPQLGLF
ncbi:MAG: DNA polymerase II [Vibrio sp.]